MSVLLVDVSPELQDNQGCGFQYKWDVVPCILIQEMDRVVKKKTI